MNAEQFMESRKLDFINNHFDNEEDNKMIASLLDDYVKIKNKDNAVTYNSWVQVITIIGTFLAKNPNDALYIIKTCFNLNTIQDVIDFIKVKGYELIKVK